MTQIFIPVNVPSSKNSKQWTGKYLVHSVVVQRYLKATGVEWMENRDLFLTMIQGLNKPHFVHLTFLRDSRRKFDYHNACQIIFDVMKEWSYILDDNADEVVPVYGRYQYNKEKPGVIIRVLSEPPQYGFI